MSGPYKFCRFARLSVINTEQLSTVLSATLQCNKSVLISCEIKKSVWRNSQDQEIIKILLLGSTSSWLTVRINCLTFTKILLHS